MKKRKEFDISAARKHSQDCVEVSLLSNECLKKVLNSISYVVGIYRQDHSIAFLNKAGCSFYKVAPEKISSKKCYQLPRRDRECLKCPFGEKTESLEKGLLLRKLGQYVERYCSPIFDLSGQVVYLLEVLKVGNPAGGLDIVPKDPEYSPRRGNFFPFSIMLMVEGIIVLANEQTFKLFGKTANPWEIADLNVCLNSDLMTCIKRHTEKMLNHDLGINVFNYHFVYKNTIAFELKVNLSLLDYAGKKAVLAFIRIANDSTRGKELYAAAEFQKQVIQRAFPFVDRADLETLYLPAKIVSGDFYFFQRINEDLMVGIIGDVSGKGITAALSISAFNVLFHEAALANHNPLEIVKVLNEKIVDYLDEKYVAVCCFSLDFAKREAKIVGAGINQFIFLSHSGKWATRTVRGPFLGMFENCVFDQAVIQFRSGDRLYFFTDGLDNILLDRKFVRNCLRFISPAELIKLLTFTDLFIDTNELSDDCTLLSLVIK